MKSADPKREFRELLAASGWKQAEAARQLAMTPSALSQIVRDNSPVKPSKVTLRLFKLLLLREKPEALRAPPAAVRRTAPAGADKWEAELIRSLRKISPEKRQPLLEAISKLIQLGLGEAVPAKARRQRTGESRAE
jgi:transcriptional regulator with XRE-family HTH domain